MKSHGKIESSNKNISCLDLDDINVNNLDLVYNKEEQKLYLLKNTDILIFGNIFHFNDFYKMIKQSKVNITEEVQEDLYQNLAEKIKNTKEFKVINQQISEEDLLDSNEEYYIENENDFNSFEKILRKSKRFYLIGVIRLQKMELLYLIL